MSARRRVSTIGIVTQAVGQVTGRIAILRELELDLTQSGGRPIVRGQLPGRTQGLVRFGVAGRFEGLRPVVEELLRAGCLLGRDGRRARPTERRMRQPNEQGDTRDSSLDYLNHGLGGSDLSQAEGAP